MEKRKALIIGKFCPFHVGHMYFLEEAVKKCDELFVILSYDQRFVDKQPKEIQTALTLKTRVKALKEFINYYLHYDNCRYPVSFDVVDESDIPEYPNGWEPFIKLVQEKLNKYNYEPNIIFSSEPSYSEDYKKYLPNCEHIIIDPERKKFNVSGTSIRHMMYVLEKTPDDSPEHKQLINKFLECVDSFTSVSYFRKVYP